MGTENHYFKVTAKFCRTPQLQYFHDHLFRHWGRCSAVVEIGWYMASRWRGGFTAYLEVAGQAKASDLPEGTPYLTVQSVSSLPPSVATCPIGFSSLDAMVSPSSHYFEGKFVLPRDTQRWDAHITMFEDSRKQKTEHPWRYTWVASAGEVHTLAAVPPSRQLRDWFWSELDDRDDASRWVRRELEHLHGIPLPGGDLTDIALHSTSDTPAVSQGIVIPSTSPYTDTQVRALLTRVSGLLQASSGFAPSTQNVGTARGILEGVLLATEPPVKPQDQETLQDLVTRAYNQ